MQQHRIISLASILAMLLIPVLGWFLVAQPQLDAARFADEQRTEVESQIVASAATVAQLKEDSAKLPELNDDLNDLRRSIPADVDSSGYIDGLDALATLAKVEITGLTVGEAQAYVAAVPPVDPNAVAPDAAAAPGATPAPVVVAEPTPGIVTNGMIDSSNFVAIPVTVEVTGTQPQILKFVQGLQSSPRLFLVTKFQTDDSATTANALTAIIGGYIWAIPTGVAGNPHPISTTVKHLTTDAAPDETAGTDDGTGTPDPNSTATPDPTSTDAPAGP